MKRCGILITLLLLCLCLVNSKANNSLNFGFPDYLQELPGDEFGILLETASLWIGLPDERSAMVLAKIPAGTRVKILGLEKQYYKVIHKHLIGYLDQRVVGIFEESTKKYRPQPVVYSENKAESNNNISSEKQPSHEDKTEKEPTNPTLVSTPKKGSFVVTKATSLREYPDSKSQVFIRFKPGAEIHKVLDKSNKYWWLVEYKGHTGWVKCALLKE
ncbi:MAG: hypothetical protein DHS20C18_15690 [Saprospiraceae bacterium]|nr:MAG: hypothetical protein DHS20C18_15690 [Saprospiraceae bacterium]